MAKRSLTLLPTKYRRKLLTAAGIFAAGSVVGSSLEVPSMSAYFEVIAPEIIKITDSITSVQLSGETAETSREEPVIPSDPQPAEPSVSAPEQPAVQSPEPAPEVSVPEVTPLPDPAPVPEIPTETEPEEDWMTGIFVPAEPVPAPETPYDDWMEVPSWQSPESAPSSPDTSSMTEELAGLLENLAVFWSSADNKIHLDPACPDAAVLFAGTVEEAQTVRTDGWCRRCAEHLDGTDNTVFYIKGNSFAVRETLISVYTYSDYLNGIPSEEFGG